MNDNPQLTDLYDHLAGLSLTAQIMIAVSFVLVSYVLVINAPGTVVMLLVVAAAAAAATGNLDVAYGCLLAGCAAVFLAMLAALMEH